MKYIKFNLFTMSTIINFFTSTDRLRAFIYDVQQEEGGHGNLGNFANGYGQFFGRRSLFFPTYLEFSTIF